MMGCASSQSGNLPGKPVSEKATADCVDNNENSSPMYPPAEAFEISLDDVHNDNENDDRSDSLIKNHPPKRLQKLVEQAATSVTPTTIEHLEEKLAKAEVRRKQYLQQKIDNIITLTGKGVNAVGVSSSSETGSNDQNDGQNDEHNNDGNVSVYCDAVISKNTKYVSDILQPQSDVTSVNTNVHIQTETKGVNDADNRTDILE